MPRSLDPSSHIYRHTLSQSEPSESWIRYLFVTATLLGLLALHLSLPSYPYVLYVPVNTKVQGFNLMSSTHAKQDLPYVADLLLASSQYGFEYVSHSRPYLVFSSVLVLNTPYLDI